MSAPAPKKLLVHHHEWIRQKFLGRTNSEIAATCGVTSLIVHLVLKSSLAQAEFSRLKAAAEHDLINGSTRLQVLQKMNNTAGAALDLADDIIRGATQATIVTRANVALKVLDRTLLKPDVKHDDDEGSFRDLLRGMKRLEDQMQAGNAPGVINVTKTVEAPVITEYDDEGNVVDAV